MVVFTPASMRGVPLCADPVDAAAARLPAEERVRAVSRTASRIASLLGYDLDGDKGAGLVAVFDHCLSDMARAGRAARSLKDVSDHLEGLGAGLSRYTRYLDERTIRAACRRAARLDVGARRLLFSGGVPIDIDLLLGRGPVGTTPPGKTRVAILYLNSLHAQEDKEFLVATVADRLVSWMLEHPSPELQALFYIDEVAPYLPPVRKPACKDDLQVLFKQARKFGVGCVVATQNPGDLDYKAVSQFGTWALGRLATRQDVKKVEPALRSLAPAAAGDVATGLPGLRPGELVLVSPDVFDAPCPLATRRLWTEHRTLDEEAIAELAGPWRERFASAVQGAGEPAGAGAARPAPGGRRVPMELDVTLLASDLQAGRVPVELDETLLARGKRKLPPELDETLPAKGTGSAGPAAADRPPRPADDAPRRPVDDAPRRPATTRPGARPTTTRLGFRPTTHRCFRCPRDPAGGLRPRRRPSPPRPRHRRHPRPQPQPHPHPRRQQRRRPPPPPPIRPSSSATPAPSPARAR